MMPVWNCCACPDEPAHQITLEPVDAFTGEGAVQFSDNDQVLCEGAAGGPGSRDFIMSTNEIQGILKKPEIIRFKVRLTRLTAENFGLAHMPMEDGSQSLLVVELRPDGPMDRWNAEQRNLSQPDLQVRPGDRIVSVGDAKGGDLDGMRQLLRQEKAEFIVERWPPTLSVSLKKRTPNDKYGMQTDLIIRDDGTKILRVGRISGGLLGESNALAARTRRFFDVVGPFAQIVSVNGERGDPERMQQVLVTDLTVDVSFTRPDPELYNH